MKTEVIMQRTLHGVKVRQSSKTGFFNANDLLDLYNQDAVYKKRLQSYMEMESTRRYLSEIVADMNNSTIQSSTISSEFGSELTSASTAFISKKGKNGGTWMHPYLFVDFAMWLSPQFKLTCVKWIYDKLIDLRNDCGDSFKEVNKALFMQNPHKVPAPFEYANEARMINKVVFGDASAGQRNLATQEQLDLLARMQKADIRLIQEGKDYHDRYIALMGLKKYLT